MDPQATLRRIFDKLSADDWEEAFYACLDLQKWLVNGGFAPKGHDRESLLAFVRVVKLECKRSSVAPLKSE